MSARRQFWSAAARRSFSTQTKPPNAASPDEAYSSKARASSRTPKVHPFHFEDVGADIFDGQAIPVAHPLRGEPSRSYSTVPAREKPSGLKA
jgi:hypothetical protein